MDDNERIAESMLSLAQAFFVIRMREKGVSPPQHDPGYWVMRMLPRDGLPISEIGRRLNRSKSGMTALIDRLIDEGRVRRVPDRVDKRVINVLPTSKGRRFMQKKKAEVKAILASRLSRLPPERRARLSSALEEANSIINDKGSD